MAPIAVLKRAWRLAATLPRGRAMRYSRRLAGMPISFYRHPGSHPSSFPSSFILSRKLLCFTIDRDSATPRSLHLDLGRNRIFARSRCNRRHRTRSALPVRMTIATNSKYGGRSQAKWTMLFQSQKSEIRSLAGLGRLRNSHRTCGLGIKRGYTPRRHTAYRDSVSKKS